MLSELTVLYDQLQILQFVHQKGEKSGNIAIYSLFGGDQYTRAHRAIISQLGLLSEAQLVAVAHAYATFEGWLITTKWNEQQFDKLPLAEKERRRVTYQSYMGGITNCLMGVEVAIQNLGGKAEELASIRRQKKELGWDAE